MDLVHYHSEAFELERDRVYRQSNSSFHEKPNGLWVSVWGNMDWYEWCIEEDFRLEELSVAHDVVLDENPNVIVLSDMDMMKSFEAAYGRGDDRYIAIDWKCVSQDYSGIIIAPYQFEARFKSMWYYGWDAASGCIWDLSVVKEFSPSTIKTSRKVR